MYTAGCSTVAAGKAASNKNIVRNKVKLFFSKYILLIMWLGSNNDQRRIYIFNQYSFDSWVSST
jgi:hypothetical protein